MSSTSEYKASELSEQLPAFLSKEAVARLANVPDARTVETNLTPDAWLVGPNGRKWPLYLPQTALAFRDERLKAAGK